MRGVGTVGLYVRDQDEALAFYVDKLGFRVHTDVRRTGGIPWGPCRRRRLCSRRGAGEGAGLGAGGPGTRSGRSFERGLRVRTSSATWGDRAGGER